MPVCAALTLPPFGRLHSGQGCLTGILTHLTGELASAQIMGKEALCNKEMSL